MKRLLTALILLAPFSAMAQEADLAFRPLGNAALAITASTAASTGVALTQTEYPSWQEYVVNTGAQTAFLAFGTSAIAATTTSIPLPAGGTKIFTLNEGQTYASSITTTGSTSVYMVGGRGK